MLDMNYWTTEGLILTGMVVGMVAGMIAGGVVVGALMWKKSLGGEQPHGN